MDEPLKCTTDGKPFDPSLREDGQQKNYVVLCEEERAKGYVRPLRRSYKHVGIRPTYPLRDLTPEEHEQYDKFGYVAYEEYPESESPKVGRFWTERDLNSGCGTVTTMGLALCETYARDPSFYGATFCTGCGKHLPVAEFRWVEDGEVVGS